MKGRGGACSKSPTCTPPPPMIFRSKLKVCERNCDKRRDNEQDSKDDAQNAIKCVRLIETPNCVIMLVKIKRDLESQRGTLPAAKSSEISM